MTSTKEHDRPVILVDASREEVENILREEFSEDDFAQLSIDMTSDPEEELLGAHRGAEASELLIVAVKFVGSAIAGGYIHDRFKAALSALARRLGKDRILNHQAEESNETIDA